MSYLTAPETEIGVSEPAFMMSAGTVTGIERIVLTSPLVRVRTTDRVSARESTPDAQNIFAMFTVFSEIVPLAPKGASNETFVTARLGSAGPIRLPLNSTRYAAPSVETVKLFGADGLL